MARNLIEILCQGWFGKFLVLALLLSAALLFKQVSSLYYLVAFCGLILMIAQRQFPKELDIAIRKWFIITFAFVFYLVLSAVFLNDASVLFGYRFEVFRDLLFLPFLAAFVYSLSISRDTLFKVVVLVASYAIFYDVLILVKEPARGQGLLSVPISRGNMGMLWGLLALISFFFFKSGYWKVLAFLAFCAGVLLSLLSGSRGGWGAFVITFGLFFLYFYHLNRKCLFFSVVLLLVFFIIVFFLWDHLPLASRIHQTIVNIDKYFNGDPQSSIGYRFEMWKAALMAFMEKPLFGWGFGNFDLYFTRYMNEGLVVGNPGGWGHAHNDYLLFLSELGMIGFLLFMLFILYPLFAVGKFFVVSFQNKDEKNVLLSLVFFVAGEAMMEFSLSDQVFTTKYFMFTYVALFLLVYSVLSKSQVPDEEARL